MQTACSVLIVTIGVFISGCTSIRAGFFPPTPVWPFDTHPCESQTCTEAHGVKAFASASSFCRSVQNFYENSGNRSSVAQLGVGLFGTLAGTVGGQIASGSAAKAWSGLSGASNAFQASLDQTFSAAVSLKRQSAVHDATVKYLHQTLGEPAPVKRVNLSIAMALECSIAAAKADAKSLQAIGSSSNTVDTPPSSAPAAPVPITESVAK